MKWLTKHNLMHGVISLCIITAFGFVNLHWEAFAVMVAFNYGIETRDNLWQRKLSGFQL